MTASEYVFEPMAKLPLRMNCICYMPKPLFYPKDSNSIITSTAGYDTNAGVVFKYNIDNNNLEMLLKFVDIEAEDHQQFIDYSDDTLHILEEINEHITINLKTKTINRNKIYCGNWPKSVQVSSTKGDEIHIFSDFKHHFKFDCNDKDFISVNSTN
eukprot:163332_1